MYAMLCIRQDITQAVSVMSRNQSNTRNEHCFTVKYIIKYLIELNNVFWVYGDVH